MTTTEAIKKWQGIIGVKPDGIFGYNTDIATRSWQAGHGLTVDGVVGPNTWASANVTGAPTIRNTTSTKVINNTSAQDFSTSTKIWQKIVGVLQTGVFDATTDAATRVWQLAHGIAPDGIVGVNTWKAVGYMGNMPILKIEAILSATSIVEAVANPVQAMQDAVQVPGQVFAQAVAPAAQFKPEPAIQIPAGAFNPEPTAANPLLTSIASAVQWATPQPAAAQAPAQVQKAAIVPFYQNIPMWAKLTAGGLLAATIGLAFVPRKK